MKFKKFIKERWRIAAVGVVIAFLLTLFPVNVQVEQASPSDSPTIGTGEYHVSFIIGTEASAAGTADYTCDGTADDVQFNAALLALPAGGGRIVVLSGSYDFDALVSRAIDNVIFQGMGLSSFISRDGINPSISAGAQSNWVFRDLRFDVGVNVAGATGWVKENVLEGATYVALQTAGGILPDADSSHDIGASGNEWASIYADDVYTAAGSLHIGSQDVTSDADSVDFPQGVDVGSRALTDTGTQLQVDSYSIPRAATFTVAASDSLASSKAQADYVCDGTDDQVQIQAALDALPADGGKILFMEGDYSISSSIIIPAGQYGIHLSGYSDATSIILADNSNCSMITYGSSEQLVTLLLTDILLQGNRNNQTIASAAVNITGKLADLYATGLVILGSKGQGLYVAPAHGDLHGFIFLRSVIEECDGTAVEFDASSHHIRRINFTDTIIAYNEDIGLKFTGLVSATIHGGVYIKGSTIMRSKKQGILIEGCTLGILITNCFIADNSWTNSGVYADVELADDGSSNPTRNVSITNCYFGRVSIAPSKHAVEISSDNATNIVVDDCIITRTTDEAILLPSEPDKSIVVSDRHSDGFLDIQAVTADYIVAAEDISAGGNITCTLAAQADIPRNFTLAITDGDTSITGFTIEVVGVDAKGYGIIENWVFADGLTQTGGISFATVTSVKTINLVGAGALDTLDVGIGSKLGLSNVIYNNADVYKVSRTTGTGATAADYPVGSYSANATYDTVDMAPGAGIAGGDCYIVWYDSNLNILYTDW